jgi:hypothetical protein
MKESSYARLLWKNTRYQYERAFSLLYCSSLYGIKNKARGKKREEQGVILKNVKYLHGIAKSQVKDSTGTSQ